MIQKNVIEQLLPAIAYGDAAGLPFESHKAGEVREGSIKGLIDTERNPYLGKYPKGTWSDDSHLSIAVAKSLIDADGFDLASQAAWHIAAYEHVKGSQADSDLVPPIVTIEKQQSGWGRSTTQSVERLVAGIDPQESGEAEGAGNGVLMKLAPLVLWQMARETSEAESEAQITALTRMTHQAEEVTVSSLVHARYLKCLFGGDTNPKTLLKEAWFAAHLYETDSSNRVVSQCLGEVGLVGVLDRKAILTAFPSKKRGFYAPETLAMAYGSFATQSQLPDSIFRAVELGGDADSVGSIVATMSLATNPESTIQAQPDYEKVFDVERLERISKQLADAACASVETAS